MTVFAVTVFILYSYKIATKNLGNIENAREYDIIFISKDVKEILQ